ncbi:MAG: VOC family protein [Bacteroidetes bacterium]|nr:VOC family protein [Bacteroidota bacterium]
MKIAHIAIWTKDLEAMKAFYCRYFEGVSSAKYLNPEKKFESYFISFKSGAKLELMRQESVTEPLNPLPQLGITHIAFKLGSSKAVILLTEKLRSDGYRIVGEPRLTGDGYFESVVLDVEGNRIELLA